MAFRGKVALVTGGGSGMGQRFCERMAAEGALVAALDVNEEGLAKTAATSDRITTFAVDVTDTAAVEQVVEKVSADLGPIDRTVAAAGIMPTDKVVDMDTATILKTMAVNYDGVVNVVKATLDGMLARNSGDMIMFASLQGHQPLTNQAAYCASKAAVKSFAEILWQEQIRSNVRFACVSPPQVRTPLMDQVNDTVGAILEMMPDRTFLTPDDVIDAIEKGLEKGRFWIMPGIAKPAATYYRYFPRLFWKGVQKLEDRQKA
jgi:NADP-dependent 3-hydroxy acid dehydrogenase YdfG